MRDTSENLQNDGLANKKQRQPIKKNKENFQQLKK